MKPIYSHAAAALGLTFALAACIPSPESTPPPEPVATPSPTPTPTPPPVVTAPEYENWLDAPQTPGDWRYERDPREHFAIYMSGQQPRFWIGCRLAERRAFIVHPGAARSQTLTIRTETATRVLKTEPAGERGGGVAKLDANDPLLDAIALTRGRFAVETAGQPTLYLPAWAEVTRVIEDCR